MIDTKYKKVEYVNAGHPPGIIITDKGTIAQLTEGCIAIGLMPKMPITKGIFSYEGPLRIFLYTDGVFDISQCEISIEIKKLEDYLLANNPVENYHIFKQIKALAESGSNFQDDICMVDIKVLQPYQYSLPIEKESIEL